MELDIYNLFSFLTIILLMEVWPMSNCTYIHKLVPACLRSCLLVGNVGPKKPASPSGVGAGTSRWNPLPCCRYLLHHHLPRCSPGLPRTEAGFSESRCRLQPHFGTDPSGNCGWTGASENRHCYYCSLCSGRASKRSDGWSSVWPSSGGSAMTSFR